MEDNLPVTEQDLRVLSTAAIVLAGNPVVNGAIDRLASAFIKARRNGEKSITIPLDGVETSLIDTVDLIVSGEEAIYGNR